MNHFLFHVPAPLYEKPWCQLPSSPSKFSCIKITWGILFAIPIPRPYPRELLSQSVCDWAYETASFKSARFNQCPRCCTFTILIDGDLTFSELWKIIPPQVGRSYPQYVHVTVIFFKMCLQGTETHWNHLNQKVQIIERIEKLSVPIMDPQVRDPYCK